MIPVFLPASFSRWSTRHEEGEMRLSRRPCSSFLSTRTRAVLWPAEESTTESDIINQDPQKDWINTLLKRSQYKFRPSPNSLLIPNSFYQAKLQAVRETCVQSRKIKDLEKKKGRNWYPNKYLICTYTPTLKCWKIASTHCWNHGTNLDLTQIPPIFSQARCALQDQSPNYSCQAELQAVRATCM